MDKTNQQIHRCIRNKKVVAINIFYEMPKDDAVMSVKYLTESKCFVRYLFEVVYMFFFLYKNENN